MNIYRNMLNKRFLAPVAMAVLSAGIFASCGDSKKEETKEEIVEPVDTVKTAVLNVGGELFSVPSPIQTAMLIKKSGVAYDKSILNISNKANTYTNDFM